MFSLGLILAMALSLLSPISSAVAQGTADGNARALLAKMTPEERVGQLFLVSFTGTDISPQSNIYDLIVHHHIGGVVLSEENDNFVAAPATLTEADRLISGLQEIEWNNSLDTQSSNTGDLGSYAYIPLFIGIDQPGDGLSHDQILSGLSAIAPEMAIGATWNTDTARQTGTVLGSELSALGFNLYLGPSLDVLTSPAASQPGDPGTLVFGGDPFWVGAMGQSYIEGLHSGSKGRMAVIARNFPGRGEADRRAPATTSVVRSRRRPPAPGCSSR